MIIRTYRHSLNSVKPLLVFFLVFSATTCFGQTLVAHTVAGSSNGTSVTTSGINTTGANLIVLAPVLNNGTTVTPTDSNSNTWTAITCSGCSVGNGPMVTFY